MNNEIKTKKLIRTSQSWDGVQLPEFPLAEVVGTIHRGENRGKKPVILNMFYSKKK